MTQACGAVCTPPIPEADREGLGAAFEPGSSSRDADRLEAGLVALGLPEPKARAECLLAFAELLLDANRHTNLVGVKTIHELIAPHVLDSLAPLAGMKLASPIIDLGSGAGLPGVAAAIVWPRLRFVLVEPRAKRAQFLSSAVRSLGLRNAEVSQRTAQAMAADPHVTRAGTVLARALAKPESAIRLALPLLRPGGRLVLYQGRAVRPTMREQQGMWAGGGRLREARRVAVPYLDAQRHVWVIEKAPRSQVRKPHQAR